MSAPIQSKARTYRDFLTPLLHRRFTDASLLVLCLCWTEATLLSSSTLFWTLLPFSVTGLRTLLLFIPCLAVFIVRLTDLHFGARTETSDLNLVRKEVFSIRALMVAVWYTVSAAIFGEVYIWSKGHEGYLGMVDYGRAYERPRLNENPMVLRTLYLVTAGVASFSHVYWDKGYVSIDQRQHFQAASGGLIARLPDTIQQVTFKTGPIARYAFDLSAAGVVTTTLTYHLIWRNLALIFAQSFGTMTHSELPRRAGFVGIINFGTFIWQAVTSALLLTVLWSFSNAVFSAYIAQPPLKKRQPLTNEVRDNAGRLVSKSGDPNASLLTGLRSKKETAHTFALWELMLICTQFEARRKTIFLEVDKQGGSTWSQVSQQCLSELQNIDIRISAQQAPATSPVDTSPAQIPTQGLPRIATEQVRQDNILNKPLPDLSHKMSDMAKAAGSHPDAQSPISPVAKNALAWSKQHLLSPQQRAKLSSEGLHRETNTKVLEILRTPLGLPFRQTFERRTKAVILGSPYSSKDNIVHAAQSLAALLKASLLEDTCGCVAKDIPTILRTFTATISKIKSFVQSTKPHWTDVHFNERQRQIKDVSDLVVELQTALEVIVLAFSEYASALGISKKELREAKEAIGMHDKHEMIKI